VTLVNEDQGAVVQGYRADVGASLASGVEGSAALTSCLKLRSATLTRVWSLLGHHI
jgi:hypothetical protein